MDSPFPGEDPEESGPDSSQSEDIQMFIDNADLAVSNRAFGIVQPAKGEDVAALGSRTVDPIANSEAPVPQHDYARFLLDRGLYSTTVVLGPTRQSVEKIVSLITAQSLLLHAHKTAFGVLQWFEYVPCLPSVPLTDADYAQQSSVLLIISVPCCASSCSELSRCFCRVLSHISPGRLSVICMVSCVTGVQGLYREYLDQLLSGLLVSPLDEQRVSFVVTDVETAVLGSSAISVFLLRRKLELIVKNITDLYTHDCDSFADVTQQAPLHVASLWFFTAAFDLLLHATSFLAVFRQMRASTQLSADSLCALQMQEPSLGSYLDFLLHAPLSALRTDLCFLLQQNAPTLLSSTAAPPPRGSICVDAVTWLFLLPLYSLLQALSLLRCSAELSLNPACVPAVKETLAICSGYSVICGDVVLKPFFLSLPSLLSESDKHSYLSALIAAARRFGQLVRPAGAVEPPMRSAAHGFLSVVSVSPFKSSSHADALIDLLSVFPSASDPNARSTADARIETEPTTPLSFLCEQALEPSLPGKVLVYLDFPLIVNIPGLTYRGLESGTFRGATAFLPRIAVHEPLDAVLLGPPDSVLCTTIVISPSVQSLPKAPVQCFPLHYHLLPFSPALAPRTPLLAFLASLLASDVSVDPLQPLTSRGVLVRAETEPAMELFMERLYTLLPFVVDGPGDMRMHMRCPFPEVYWSRVHRAPAVVSSGDGLRAHVAPLYADPAGALRLLPAACRITSFDHLEDVQLAPSAPRDDRLLNKLASVDDALKEIDGDPAAAWDLSVLDRISAIGCVGSVFLVDSTCKAGDDELRTALTSDDYHKLLEALVFHVKACRRVYDGAPTGTSTPHDEPCSPALPLACVVLRIFSAPRQLLDQDVSVMSRSFGSLLARDSAERANVLVLEPYIRVRVMTLSDAVSTKAFSRILKERRGRLCATEPVPATPFALLEADIPAIETRGLASVLRRTVRVFVFDSRYCGHGGLALGDVSETEVECALANAAFDARGQPDTLTNAFTGIGVPSAHLASVYERVLSGLTNHL